MVVHRLSASSLRPPTWPINGAAAGLDTDQESKQLWTIFPAQKWRHGHPKPTTYSSTKTRLIYTLNNVITLKFKFHGLQRLNKTSDSIHRSWTSVLSVNNILIEQRIFIVYFTNQVHWSGHGSTGKCSSRVIQMGIPCTCCTGDWPPSDQQEQHHESSQLQSKSLAPSPGGCCFGDPWLCEARASW